MKNILASFLFMTGVTAASAAPILQGKWQSDKELTTDFIKKNVRLEDKTYKFLADMMGRLTLTFTKDHIESSLPDWDVTIEGKSHHMVGFKEKQPYSIIYNIAHVIVTKGVTPVVHTEGVTTYNFDGPDIMWIYTGSSDQVLPNSHYREYFRRIKAD